MWVQEVLPLDMTYQLRCWFPVQGSNHVSDPGKLKIQHHNKGDNSDPGFGYRGNFLIK